MFRMIDVVAVGVPLLMIVVGIIMEPGYGLILFLNTLTVLIMVVAVIFLIKFVHYIFRG